MSIRSKLFSDGFHPRINLQTKSRFSSLVRGKTQDHALFYLLEKKHLINSESGKKKIDKILQFENGRLVFFN